MSDQENKNPEQKNGPDFVAYNVRESSDGKGHWDRVGVGFMHHDGKGVDIRLNSLPMDGHITLRERAQEFKQKQEKETPKQGFSRSRSPKVE